MASKLATQLLDLLFPPRCVFCRKLLPSGEVNICPSCRRHLPYTTDETAIQYGNAFSRCVSPLFYQEDVKTSFHRFKFSGYSGYAVCYSALMTEWIHRYFADEFELITWVPLSKKRKKKRGYDQSMLLAKAIGSALSCPVVPLLQKREDRPPQSSLQGTKARFANAAGAYVVSAPQYVSGKRILLVDDIVTTGATLSECARQLRAEGAADVLCVTIARGAPLYTEKNV